MPEARVLLLKPMKGRYSTGRTAAGDEASSPVSRNFSFLFAYFRSLDFKRTSLLS
jgi:hypothetical protein